MLSDQSRIIDQTKFTYYPLGKAFEKQTKTVENQGPKQLEKPKKNKEDIKTIGEIFPKDLRTNEFNNEIKGNIKMGMENYTGRFKM